MYVNFLSTYSDKKSCHTSTTLQTSIARSVSDSCASCSSIQPECDVRCLQNLVMLIEEMRASHLLFNNYHWFFGIRSVVSPPVAIENLWKNAPIEGKCLLVCPLYYYYYYYYFFFVFIIIIKLYISWFLWCNSLTLCCMQRVDEQRRERNIVVIILVVVCVVTVVLTVERVRHLRQCWRLANRHIAVLS